MEQLLEVAALISLAAASARITAAGHVPANRRKSDLL